MRRLQNSTLAAGCLLPVGGGALAQNAGWLKGSTDEKLKGLAEIQPRLGTAMLEYSTRSTNIYYAAKSGNWDLADYQLKEPLDIQDVGETTRPKRAEALKAFEGKFQLGKAIPAKDAKAFDAAFREAEEGGNACHKDQASRTSSTGFQRRRCRLCRTRPSPPPLRIARATPPRLRSAPVRGRRGAPRARPS